MPALSFYTPNYPKKSGSVRNNVLALRKDKVNVFVLRSVFYVQLPRLIEPHRVINPTSIDCGMEGKARTKHSCWSQRW